jgi:hypothetical protein
LHIYNLTPQSQYRGSQLPHRQSMSTAISYSSTSLIITSLPCLSHQVCAIQGKGRGKEYSRSHQHISQAHGDPGDEKTDVQHEITHKVNPQIDQSRSTVLFRPAINNAFFTRLRIEAFWRGSFASIMTPDRATGHC